MDTWKKIAKQALLGTERGTFSKSLLDTFSKKGININRSEECILLDAAALYSRAFKAGYAPLVYHQEISATTTNSTKPFVSEKSIYFLKEVLEGIHQEALLEFLEQIAILSKKILPEYLPDILDKCKNNGTLWQILQKSLTTSDYILIAKHPNWQYYLEPTEDVVWEYGTKKQRTTILKHLRRNTPDKAIPLIQSTWSKDSPSQKTTFIKTLSINLSQKDEDFLEFCLKASRKEIRQAAAHLLIKIPNSNLIERLFNQLENFITVKKRLLKKEKLTFEIPDEPTPNLLKDGIHLKSIPFKGGRKASILGQLMAVIPPKRWVRYFGYSSKESLEIFIRSDWSSTLLQALIESTITHQDVEWMELLVDFWLHNQSKNRWQNIHIQNLLEVIPDDVFNRIAIKVLKEKNTVLQDSDPITNLLKSGMHYWQDELVLLYMQSIKKWVDRHTARSWEGWYYKNILKKIAYYCSPDLHEKIHNFWYKNGKTWSDWDNEIDNFLEVLKFRKQMIAELKR